MMLMRSILVFIFFLFFHETKRNSKKEEREGRKLKRTAYF
uniref:Uncharacterized protein n=1 Tax=Rhizophora mucronata TaxID=61149 RepID=A0A2P2P043_RHIMU